MRLADAGPRTWLVAALAGWALLAWVASLLGMGAPIARLDDDPALLRALPATPRPQAERLGPLSQYAETGTRPLFSEDRRPQPFSLQPQGEGEETKAFDFVLTSVLVTPALQMAIVQPAEGGDSIRMKLDEAPAEAQGWRLVSVEARAAVFAGPQGEKRLELRTYNGTGGQAPTRRTAARPPAQPQPQVAQQPVPVEVQDADDVPAPPAPEPPPANATAQSTGSTLPETPMTPEAQMEAIRKRIEQRRAQLRQEAQRQQQSQPTQPAK